MFLTRKLRRDSLSEIGRQFQMEKYSSINSIIERMKKQMLADRNLKGSPKNNFPFSCVDPYRLKNSL